MNTLGLCVRLRGRTRDITAAFCGISRNNISFNIGFASEGDGVTGIGANIAYFQSMAFGLDCIVIAHRSPGARGGLIISYAQSIGAQIINISTVSQSGQIRPTSDVVQDMINNIP